MWENIFEKVRKSQTKIFKNDEVFCSKTIQSIEK